MCGRYTLTRNEDAIADLQASLEIPAQTAMVGVPGLPGDWWKPRFNIAPTQPAPVVTLRSGARTLELMRWGLVPFWAGREGKKSPLMINARVESLGAKAVFRDALERKRCLVPADGFFEWKREGKQPRPIYFHREPRRIFAFAGLWARARTEAGDLYSFTIITGKPNELVKSVHDRMPIVLADDAHAAWLDPTVDADGARALLGISPVDGWRAEPVSTRVNAAAHDDPECIAPVAPLQLSLDKLDGAGTSN